MTDVCSHVKEMQVEVPVVEAVPEMVVRVSQQESGKIPSRCLLLRCQVLERT